MSKFTSRMSSVALSVALVLAAGQHAIAADDAKKN